MNKIILATIATAIIVGTGSFFGGMQYQKSQMNINRRANQDFAEKGFGQNNSSASANRASRTDTQKKQDGSGPSGARGNNMFGGEITAKDDKSITIQTKDSGSKIIYFSDTTTVGKIVDGLTSDLSVGQQIMASGQTDSAGILTAQNIQIRPDTPLNQTQ